MILVYVLVRLRRATLGHIVAGGLTLALVWVSSGANPADYLSRGIPIPPPGVVPPAFAHLMQPSTWRCAAGLEIFAGLGAITAACRAAGHMMLDPWDVRLGSQFDVLVAANIVKLKR